MPYAPTPSPQGLVDVALGQRGYVEQGGSDGHSGNLTVFGKKYGLDGYAWCSIFVWWCFFQMGIDVRQVLTKSYASADAAMRGFEAHGWKIAGTDHHPLPGDVVFFHFSGEHAGANHTGIVVDADSGGVHTVEGNTSSGDKGSQVNGGQVAARYRPWSVIIGYGRYPFPKGTPPPAQPKSAAKSYPTLQHGSTGEDVRRLEGLLHIPVDPAGRGMFGPQCEKAVRAFQARKHLQVDGVAGPATLRALGW